jgi:hypothetical protein
MPASSASSGPEMVRGVQEASVLGHAPTSSPRIMVNDLPTDA